MLVFIVDVLYRLDPCFWKGGITIQALQAVLCTCHDGRPGKGKMQVRWPRSNLSTSNILHMRHVRIRTAKIRIGMHLQGAENFALSCFWSVQSATLNKVVTVQ